MSVEVGRRVFVGSVVTGLPLFVGGGTQLGFAQRQSGAAAATDPVAIQLITEMKRAVRGLSQAPSGEHARRLASSLRLLATWGASNQFDARVKETLRGVVAREGRDALIRRDVDPAMFKAEARELGFDGASAVPLPAFPSVDYASRQRVLDDLLANGVTAQWRALAGTLETAASGLDRMASRRSAGMTLVAQTDPSICRMIQQEMYYLSVQMAFWCAPWFYWVPEPCGLTTSAYLGVAAAAWWYSC
jgi:hypothetical protein